MVLSLEQRQAYESALALTNANRLRESTENFTEVATKIREEARKFLQSVGIDVDIDIGKNHFLTRIVQGQRPSFDLANEWRLANKLLVIWLDIAYLRFEMMRIKQHLDY